MRFNIVAIFAAALLYALTNASPLPARPSFRTVAIAAQAAVRFSKIGANAKTPVNKPSVGTSATVPKAAVLLYRNGNTQTPVSKMRTQDWNMKDGHVHPSDKKGLSTNTNPKNLGPGHKWSLLADHVKNHPQFKAVHDGPKGHVTLAYHGPPAPAQQVQAAIRNLPWKHEGKK
jgi:hypothetical protein